MEFKDYYKTLGVERGASSDEIKKAFRKLARKFHPDVAKDKKSAEAAFKEINEANEVLGDEEKRKKYDTLGPDWERISAAGGTGAANPFAAYPGEASFRPRRRRAGQASGGATEDAAFSNFFEAMFGQAGIDPDGFEIHSGLRPNGARTRNKDITSDIVVTLEEALKGSVRDVTVSRPATGKKPERWQHYQITIPPGVRDGYLVRMAGQGEAGAGKSKAGDLFLRVRLEKHPTLRPEGADLYYDLNLAPWEAVLGCQIEIPTLEGQVNLKVPLVHITGRHCGSVGKDYPI